MGAEQCRPGAEQCRPADGRCAPIAAITPEQRCRLSQPERRRRPSHQGKQRGSALDSPTDFLRHFQRDVERPSAWGPRQAYKAQLSLNAAVAKGDVGLLIQAVADGASVTERDARGVTPMMLAAGGGGGQGAVEVIQELLRLKAPLDAEDELGFKAVHHAARAGNAEVVRFLLGQRAHEAPKRSRDGQTLLILALWQNKVEVVQELLNIPKVKALVNEKDGAQGRSPLHVCAAEGLLDIAKLLIKKGARICTKDNIGRQPLALACANGHTELAKYLCKKGADVDAVDRSKRSALLHAALNRHEQLACWLLLHGRADPSLRDSMGESLVDLAQAMHFKEVRRSLNELKGESLEDESAQAVE